MIAGIKNDIKRMFQSTFPEVEKLVNVFSDTIEMTMMYAYL
jgi:Fe-S cluster biogenesis protein NfuA